MDKLNKPFLMALAIKQSELLIESTHVLQDMLTSLSTSTVMSLVDTTDRKLTKLVVVLNKVAAV